MINAVLRFTLMTKYYTGHRVQSKLQFDIIDNNNDFFQPKKSPSLSFSGM